MHGAILYISALKNAHGAGSPKKRHTSIGAKPKESHCLDFTKADSKRILTSRLPTSSLNE
jgi:hypothetical protein|tara:strand:- start:274 stop:453 length:180 start_codon:yes stop_codon:yes gene_type:complete